MQHRRTHSPQRLIIMHEHVIAFTIAFFAVAAIGGILMYRGTLFADITRSANQGKNSSPVVYSIENGSLNISTTAKFTTAASMTFFVVFDPKNVLLQLEKAQSPYNYTYAPGMDTMVQVTVFTKGDIPSGTLVYSVPMNGTVENVTIANAGVLRQDGKFETLAIQKNNP